jgi:hypothetical protein
MFAIFKVVVFYSRETNRNRAYYEIVFVILNLNHPQKKSSTIFFNPVKKCGPCAGGLRLNKVFFNLHLELCVMIILLAIAFFSIKTNLYRFDSFTILDKF